MKATRRKQTQGWYFSIHDPLIHNNNSDFIYATNRCDNSWLGYQFYTYLFRVSSSLQRAFRRNVETTRPHQRIQLISYTIFSIFYIHFIIIRVLYDLNLSLALTVIHYIFFLNVILGIIPIIFACTFPQFTYYTDTSLFAYYLQGAKMISRDLTTKFMFFFVCLLHLLAPPYTFPFWR